MVAIASSASLPFPTKAAAIIGNQHPAVRERLRAFREKRKQEALAQTEV